MPRWVHGRAVTEDALNEAREAIAERVAEVGPAFALVKRVEFERCFDFLFLELQDDPDNLLPVARKTRDDLVRLGEVMADDGTDAPAGDTKNLSAAYTYFGQFLDHDITLEKSAQPSMAPPVGEDLEPLPLEDVREQTRNVRTGVLELDSVYNTPALRDSEPNGLKMKIGKVVELNGSQEPTLRPPGKDDFNDLPRRGRSNNIERDREALIGDPRNDENLIVAQLHLAFLHAHNKLVDESAPPNRFMKAKRRLRRHYQHNVLHDFLKQIADPLIVDDIIENGNRVYDPGEDEFFMPLEFAVAAYRFGHSMVRAEYDYNLNFNTKRPETSRARIFPELFMFTALMGQLADFDTLPENWIVQWENFFRGASSSTGPARSTHRSSSRSKTCRPWTAKPRKGSPQVSPSGTSCAATTCACPRAKPWPARSARALSKKLRGVRDIPVLSPQQIKSAAASDRQRQVLRDAGFDERTPLWYYIVAEASAFREGRRLGPVGSTIVAEVLVGLVRRSPDSILALGSTWKPNLPSEEPGEFTLADLLRYA
jgi:hypothetical protein